MTKLIIQIPCLNEAETLPETIAALPRWINGIDVIEYMVIDDGSSDDTAQVARRWGVHHVVQHRRNRGLAAAFRSGIDAALAAGADIIVNTDADGQYEGEDIASLVQPILHGRADIVVGDRGVADNRHFHPFKRLLQRLGSRVVQKLAGTEVNDAVSGFRAISRDAARRINITTEFSYTTDMLIQAGRKRMAIATVPVRTHAAKRPSRLFKSIPAFIGQTGVTIMRAYTTHNALRVFVGTGMVVALLGAIPILRFLWFWATGDSGGHIQSLVIGGALLMLGTIMAVMGILADLIATNRKLLEMNLQKLRQLEEAIAKQNGDAPAATSVEAAADIVPLDQQRKAGS
ncbi:glycosyltransferase family 2 protein [Alteraurantiacibacter aquimixticola]|uniref:Glycosyltransferase family 2 protein n=1 Tax=Alteraurantiacibacter aquimixticola TaxID=2489173 RepID=A0A4T3F3Y8_9SPHN|nr:glycosyltransferase family 2 protein [Alteraurantiacibacter aquimixticola]TIX51838.1 glycosyltransferase family 2 protein [Alteraurantiacibacter aquimixticola]